MGRVGIESNQRASSKSPEVGRFRVILLGKDPWVGPDIGGG